MGTIFRFRHLVLALLAIYVAGAIYIGLKVQPVADNWDSAEVFLVGAKDKTGRPTVGEKLDVAVEFDLLTPKLVRFGPGANQGHLYQLKISGPDAGKLAARGLDKSFFSIEGQDADAGYCNISNSKKLPFAPNSASFPGAEYNKAGPASWDFTAATVYKISSVGPQPIYDGKTLDRKGRCGTIELALSKDAMDFGKAVLLLGNQHDVMVYLKRGYKRSLLATAIMAFRWDDWVTSNYDI
ncbi:hypothetical protein ACYPKM_05580 [Pseudomonas aeruginosa]